MDSRKYLDLIAEHRLSVNRPQETVALTGKILEVRDQVASQHDFDVHTPLDEWLGAWGDDAGTSPNATRSLRVLFIQDKQAILSSAARNLLQTRCGMTSSFMLGCTSPFFWTVFPTESSLTKSVLALQYGFWLWRDGSTASYVQLIADSKSFTYICVNHTKALQDTITEIVIKYPGQVCQPLFLDTLIMEDVLASYRLALAGYRDELREIEFNEKTTSAVGERAKRLHNLALVWHTIRKDLADIEQHIHHLQALSQDPTSYVNSDLAASSLQALDDSCSFWSRWVSVYLDRIKIRIDLMHHLAAQKTSVDTQLDSISMSTLAFISALFLPGTFICSVLSTDFFSYSDASMAVSAKAWILPAVMVPATFLVVFGWWGWFRYRAQRSVNPGQMRPEKGRMSITDRVKLPILFSPTRKGPEYLNGIDPDVP